MTTAAGGRRFAILAGVALAAAFVVVPASAFAAPAPSTPALLQLSNDGVTYGAALSSALYSPNIRMIPRSSQQGTFWVRNASTEAAYLRVVMGGVTGNNAALLNYLTVEADTPSTTGQALALTTAQPCRVLTQGDLLQPGDSIRIDTALAVGDLTGSAGQNGTVNFNLQVGLSSVSPAGTPSTTCITAGTTVPVFPPTPTHPTHPTGSHGGTSGSGTSVTPTASATPTPTPTVPAIDNQGPVPQFLLAVANTGRFFQEDFVWLWLLGAIAGSLLMFYLSRRRRQADDDKNGVTP